MYLQVNICSGAFLAQPTIEREILVGCSISVVGVVLMWQLTWPLPRVRKALAESRHELDAQLFITSLCSLLSERLRPAAQLGQAV
jgi:hypothetical protein